MRHENPTEVLLEGICSLEGYVDSEPLDVRLMQRCAAILRKVATTKGRSHSDFNGAKAMGFFYRTSGPGKRTDSPEDALVFTLDTSRRLWKAGVRTPLRERMRLLKRLCDFHAAYLHERDRPMREWRASRRPTSRRFAA